MTKRRLVRAAAVFSGLALVLAACGDDGETETGATTTTAGDGATTTTAAGGGGGNGDLEGMRGTTPAPETTDTVEAFQARMLEVDPELQDFSYGPEAYDAAIVIALAAQIAGDDGIGHAAEIVGVTKDGEKCTSYADCLALVEAGTDIDYDGISGPLDMSGNGEPILGSYAILEFGPDNRILDEREFRTAEAPEDVANQEFVAPTAPAPAMAC